MKNTTYADYLRKEINDLMVRQGLAIKAGAYQEADNIELKINELSDKLTAYE